MSNPAPCKDCPNRHPACHDQCEKYLAWKAELKASNDAEKLRSALGWTFSR